MPNLADHKYVHWLLALTLGLLNSIRCWVAVRLSDFPNGWSAYEHLAQVKSLAEYGQWYQSDYSLFYLPLFVFRIFTSDAILAYQLNSAVMLGVFTVSTYFLARSWRAGTWLCLLVASYMVFSPHLIFVGCQQPKLLFGLVLFNCFLIAIFSGRKIPAFILLVLSVFGQVITFFMTAVFELVYLILNKKIQGRWIYLLGVLIILFLSSLWVPIDRALVARSVDQFFGWPPYFAPYNFVKGLSANGRINFFWFIEIIWTCGLYFLLFPFLSKLSLRPLVWSLLALCTILILPFYYWSFDHHAYYFYLCFIPLTVYFLPIVLRIPAGSERKYFFIPILALILLVASIFTYQTYVPQRDDPDYISFEKTAQQLDSLWQSTPPDILIAHQPLAAYLFVEKAIHAHEKMPVNFEIKSNIFRLVRDVRLSALERQLSAAELKTIQQLGVRSYLMPEQTWRNLREKAIEENDVYLLEQMDGPRNPDIY